MEEKELIEEQESFLGRRSQLTLQIVGAALFGAISIVISVFLAPLIPRVPGWGIAYIDPVSIIWVLCFFIFGVKSGLLCCVIGTIGLMVSDPFTPIGPLMKFSATFALIIIPIILLNLYKTQEGVRNSQKLKKLSNFTITGILGISLRVVIMMWFNVMLFLTLFSDSFNYVNLEIFGMSDITGWTAIIIMVIFINVETSLWDLIIPYLIVFGGKIDQKFEIW
jgi:riboflavin transporter FmnP